MFYLLSELFGSAMAGHNIIGRNIVVEDVTVGMVVSIGVWYFRIHLIQAFRMICLYCMGLASVRTYVYIFLNQAHAQFLSCRMCVRLPGSMGQC